MKKKYLLMFFIIILLGVCSFFIGTYIYKLSRIDNNMYGLVTDDCVEEAKEYEQALLTSERENKTSPNAVIITKKYYARCGHTVKEISDINNNEVNLTREEFIKSHIKEDKTNRMELENFSPKEIVLKETIDDSCDEHYIISEKDEIIVIYKLNEKNEKVFFKDTPITTEYLTKLDVDKIKEGIKVNGKEELNKALEDFDY